MGFCGGGSFAADNENLRIIWEMSQDIWHLTNDGHHSGECLCLVRGQLLVFLCHWSFDTMKLNDRKRQIICTISKYQFTFPIETFNSIFLKCNNSSAFSFLHSKLPRYPVNVDTYVTITFFTPYPCFPPWTLPRRIHANGSRSFPSTPLSNGTRFSFILIITKRIPIKSSSHLPIHERVRVPPPHPPPRSLDSGLVRCCGGEQTEDEGQTFRYISPSFHPAQKPNVRQLLVRLTFVLPTFVAVYIEIRKLE